MHVYLLNAVRNCHKSAHMPDQAEDVSPCMTWCYGSESYQGLMKKLASRSHLPRSFLLRFSGSIVLWDMVVKQTIVFDDKLVCSIRGATFGLDSPARIIRILLDGKPSPRINFRVGKPCPNMHVYVSAASTVDPS